MTMLPKKRVLCIGHPYVLAINRSVARELARQAGFEVTVAAPKTFHDLPRALQLEAEPPDSPLQVVGLDARGSRFIHLFRYDDRALRALLRAGSFDLVYAWVEPYVYSGWQIVRAVRACTDAKIVFRTAQNLDKRYPPPFGFFERQCVRQADGWLACGHLVFEVMGRRGYDLAKGRVIPLAVDTAAFVPSPPPMRDEVRRELGLDTPVIGYLGRLVPEKGIRVLLRALEKLPAERHWSLLCLGSGPEEATILRWAQERGWQDQVVVRLVKHSEVPRYLGAVDLLAAPSQTTPAWKEQFGRMIVEALASNVPVIGSDSGEIPHVIGPAGIVVPEADADAWASAISSLLTDPERRERYQALGLARAQRFSAADIAVEYRDYYGELLAPSR